MGKVATVVKVGIADLNVVDAPDTIRTSGLGSCVGIVLYDPGKQIAGLSHIMLPDSTLTKQRELNQLKYADTAIQILIDKLIQQRVSKNSIKAKIAGGAQMFQHHAATDVMRIGPRNVDAVTEQLKLHQIPIIASDVGGNSGRTIEFDPQTSKLKVRTVNKGETFI